MFPVYQVPESGPALIVSLHASYDDAQDFASLLGDAAMAGYTGFAYAVGEQIDVEYDDGLDMDSLF